MKYWRSVKYRSTGQTLVHLPEGIETGWDAIQRNTNTVESERLSL